MAEHERTMKDFLINNEVEILRKAVESTRGPFIITDSGKPDDPIIYCNKAFQQLTGYSQEEILGRNCRFLQGPDTDKNTVAQLREAIKAEREVQVTIKNYRKDGTAFWNELVMSPIKNDAGTLTHFVAMQFDLTERIEQEQALRKSQEELLQSNKELEQFAYIASHDLQEPLRMIVSYLGLIEKRYKPLLDEDGKTFINFAKEGGTRMQALINDLLLLSRVRKKGSVFEETDMNEVMRHVMINIQEKIKETDAQITFSELPTIIADSIQIMQLLQNLVANAIKFTPKDRKPHIIVSSERKEQGWLFSVKDHGIGISPEYFERIFAIFQRLHTREEYPGTGIGLAVCKKIVERHGGKIWVESIEGIGSTFYFTISFKPTL